MAPDDNARPVRLEIPNEVLAQFDRLGLSAQEVIEIAATRPSLRGMIMGYAAEYKAQKLWFSGPEFTNLVVPDDHDRTHKYDLRFDYKGTTVRVECKSVKGDTVRRIAAGYTGMVQCRGSDRRKITLADGVFETTNLRIGDFDLLCVNLFHFGGEWRFAFARNNELPTTTWAKYPVEIRSQLLPNFIPITWPLARPFVDSPFELLDAIVADRMRRETASGFNEYEKI